MIRAFLNTRFERRIG